jgi:hypothetical protein
MVCGALLPTRCCQSVQPPLSIADAFSVVLGLGFGLRLGLGSNTFVHCGCLQCCVVWQSSWLAAEFRVSGRAPGQRPHRSCSMRVPSTFAVVYVLNGKAGRHPSGMLMLVLSPAGVNPNSTPRGQRPNHELCHRTDGVTHHRESK